MSILRRNNVHVLGADGPPMLFVHGFGCDQTMWRLVTPAFEPTRRVVQFDYIGHGGSDRTGYQPGRYTTLQGYADEILEVCDELRLEAVTLVGHSVSAITGMLAAIREPARFAALVMVAPSPGYIDAEGYRGGFTRSDIDGLLDMLESNYLGWAATMAPVIMGAPERPQLTRELENSFCRTDPAIATQFARVTFLSDHRADLAKVPVRSLILQCARDAIAPPSVGEYMHAHMPRSTLEIIDTSGHCPHLSAPAATIAAIERFLGS